MESLVISLGIVETEVLENNVRIGGGISADSVAGAVLFAYQQPQNVLIVEFCMTPTRQEY
jgi:NADP-dependent 3-hydroxy acid dehydrogenase YdfG